MTIPATQPYTTYQDEGDGIFSVTIHEAVDAKTGQRRRSVAQMSSLILDMTLRALQAEGFPVMS